jgi:hypothetical protein
MRVTITLARLPLDVKVSLTIFFSGYLISGYLISGYLISVSARSVQTVMESPKPPLIRGVWSVIDGETDSPLLLASWYWQVY